MTILNILPYYGAKLFTSVNVFVGHTPMELAPENFSTDIINASV
jgi:hypothetical protein